MVPQFKNLDEVLAFRKTPEYAQLEPKEQRIIANKIGGFNKRGVKLERTVEKRKITEGMERYFRKRAFDLARSAMVVAMGQVFVYRIDEEEDSKGKVVGRKHVLVTDPDEIAEALDEQAGYGETTSGKYYYTTTKEPDITAIDKIFDRAFGKAQANVKVEGEVTFSLLSLAKQAREIEQANIVEAVVIHDTKVN